MVSEPCLCSQTLFSFLFFSLNPHPPLFPPLFPTSNETHPVHPVQIAHYQRPRHSPHPPRSPPVLYSALPVSVARPLRHIVLVLPPSHSLRYSAKPSMPIAALLAPSPTTGDRAIYCLAQIRHSPSCSVASSSSSRLPFLSPVLPNPPRRSPPCCHLHPLPATTPYAASLASTARHLHLSAHPLLFHRIRICRLPVPLLLFLCPSLSSKALEDSGLLHLATSVDSLRLAQRAHARTFPIGLCRHPILSSILIFAYSQHCFPSPSRHRTQQCPVVPIHSAKVIRIHPLLVSAHVDLVQST